MSSSYGPDPNVFQLRPRLILEDIIADRNERNYSCIFVMAPNGVIPDAEKAATSADTVSSVRRVAQLTGHLAPASETEQINARPALPISYPNSRLQIDANRFIDQVRPLKVAVIGAGLAGINAGILLPAKVPGIQLSIFEKNSDVVSRLDNTITQYLTFCRAAHGLRMCTRASDVTFLHMYTNPHSLQIRNGPKSLPKEQRYAITGRHKPASMACITV